jgi:hypothetical protein
MLRQKRCRRDGSAPNQSGIDEIGDPIVVAILKEGAEEKTAPNL